MKVIDIVSPIPNYETGSVMAILPVDILHYNILTKLPVKSLLRFKSVCKDWYNLINSANFINIHVKHTLVSHDDSCDFLVISLNFDVKESTLFCTYLDAPDYTSGKCTEIETLFQTCCRIVGFSNGLICFKFFGSGFLLCNPVTREYSRLIEAPSLVPVVQEFSEAHYGFGYDLVRRDYKIVNIIEFRQDCLVHVYSANSNSWKEVQKGHNSIHKINSSKSVVVNNKLHWIMSKHIMSKNIIKTILMFDLHTEEFRELSYPTSLQTHSGTPLKLTVSSGRLCTLATHYSLPWTRIVSTWVMKEYGVVESWTKLYEVVGEQISSSHCFAIITHLSRKGSEEVLLQRDKVAELVWYNLENKSITEKAGDHATPVYTEDKWVCIPSLAPIPGNDPNKRLYFLNRKIHSI